jgi:hypothetical protein
MRYNKYVEGRLDQNVGLQKKKRHKREGAMISTQDVL